MINKIFVATLFTLLFSCNVKTSVEQETSDLIGTWELVTGTTIEGSDTTITDYTVNQRMIKIINPTHFAFLRHDLKNGKDSTTAVFVSGGGRYTLKEDLYTEYLEYCNLREWENNDFEFKVTVRNDTLIQQGEENVPDAGISRIIIEKYVRTTQ